LYADRCMPLWVQFASIYLKGIPLVQFPIRRESGIRELAGDVAVWLKGLRTTI
jgi:hypothetical protein